MTEQQIDAIIKKHEKKYLWMIQNPKRKPPTANLIKYQEAISRYANGKS